MVRSTFLTALLVLSVAGGLSAQTLAQAGYQKLSQLVDSAIVMEADVFAPKMWKKASKALTKAEEAINRSKKPKTIDKHVGEATEYVENAIKATEVAKLSLSEYLPARTKAQEASAKALVPKLYNKAELQFKKATAKVESGNVKSGLKEATKSTPMFSNVEMEAIKIAILGSADKLIDKAMADDAEKYALSTLDKARTALTKAHAILRNDRYNRTDAVEEAHRAEYEARHASNIAMSVRSLKRNDQAWEKLMMLYEIQMNRVGEAAGMSFLPYDDGPLAAADSLINRINELKAGKTQLKSESDHLAEGVTDQLIRTLDRMGQSSDDADPIALAGILDEQVVAIIAQRDELSKQLEHRNSELAELTTEHERTSANLAERTAREEKFKTAKRVLNPSEGEVLFNSSNDIVLRLSGLSFDVGKSDIKDEHIPLVEKVKQVIDMFPHSRLIVEGHTDASGEAVSNQQLSEKRAFAVMQYLRQSILIPADQIKAIGYGADKPIASNQTKDGRAKNRRIDIILMQ